MTVDRLFSSRIGHFVRHYMEMVVAMVLGMFVLGIPAAGVLGLFGVSTAELHNDAPALALLGTAGTAGARRTRWPPRCSFRPLR